MKYIKPQLEITKYVIEDVMCASGVGDGGTAGGVITDNGASWKPVTGGTAK